MSQQIVTKEDKDVNVDVSNVEVKKPSEDTDTLKRSPDVEESSKLAQVSNKLYSFGGVLFTK